VTASTLSPPELLSLAGHRLRWRLLEELARSDRTVHELVGRVGEAQNLVSYHLAKLRDAGLVFSRRSSADGRDTYYAVDLTRFGELLSEAAAALHPGLRVAGPDEPEPLARPVRVLFLCTGNSARSQIAEELLRARSDGAVEVVSAGSHPKPLHPMAVEVMRKEHGLDLSANEPKPLSRFAGERFDWVISLCDRVREVCPAFDGDPATVHWSIADPSAGPTEGKAGYRAFQQLAAELDLRVGFLLAAISEGATAPAARRTRP
jgi:protein-tyrosine-phosphatase/DNA-binding transcriptional ArsR family regulator